MKLLAPFLALFVNVAFSEESLPPRQGRIVNGGFVTSDKVPYFALALKGDTGAQVVRHGCAASVIHPLYAITAAHCLYNRSSYDPLSLGKLYVGAYQPFEVDNGGRAFTTVSVVERTVHPDYVRIPHTYDIAVLKLSEPVDASFTVAIADASFDGGLVPDQVMTVYGMGRTGLFDDVAEALMKGKVNYVDQDQCESNYANYKDPIGQKAGTITDDMLCATGTSENSQVVDACSGDSGGPLVAYDVEGTPVLTGVVSWGFKCAVLPGAYSRVGLNIDWIKKVLGNDFDQVTVKSGVAPPRTTNGGRSRIDRTQGSNGGRSRSNSVAGPGPDLDATSGSVGIWSGLVGHVLVAVVGLCIAL